VNNPGPSYLRLGKVGESIYHVTPPDIQPGRWIEVHNSSDRYAILTTGAGLQIAMNSWRHKAEYVEYSIFSMPLWSMNEKNSQSQMLSMHDEVVTIEEHLIDGGFGSWLLEAKAMAPSVGCLIKPVGLNPEVCGTVASQTSLIKLGGLS
jgi:transketolase